MYFDDKYFKTEEIDGFVVDSMMKRAWAAEMEIMQEIDRICKEMTCNTMRHGEHYSEQ